MALTYKPLLSTSANTTPTLLQESPAPARVRRHRNQTSVGPFRNLITRYRWVEGPATRTGRAIARISWQNQADRTANRALTECVKMNVIDAHKFCRRHREVVLQSDLCGCFYCLNVFSPGEIEEWCHDGETAICPKCGINSVLPSDSGAPLTSDFLAEMKEHWFGRRHRVDH